MGAPTSSSPAAATTRRRSRRDQWPADLERRRHVYRSVLDAAADSRFHPLRVRWRYQRRRPSRYLRRQRWPRAQVGPYFLMGSGDGTFTQQTTGLPPQYPGACSMRYFSSCLLVDVDQDGYPDLVLGTAVDRSSTTSCCSTMARAISPGVLAWSSRRGPCRRQLRRR